jgi:hypothetical protein
MLTVVPTREEFVTVLRDEIAGIDSPNRRAFAEGLLIEPYQSQLLWEYGNDEPVLAWTFGDLKERNVVAQYCLGGHGERGSPWGINFRDATHFGQDCAWYPSLDALVADWGVAT